MSEPITETATAGVIPGNETRRFHITRAVRSGGMGYSDATEETVVACDAPPMLARALTVDEVVATTLPYDWRPVQKATAPASPSSPPASEGGV